MATRAKLKHAAVVTGQAMKQAAKPFVVEHNDEILQSIGTEFYKAMKPAFAGIKNEPWLVGNLYDGVVDLLDGFPASILAKEVVSAFDHVLDNCPYNHVMPTTAEVQKFKTFRVLVTKAFFDVLKACRGVAKWLTTPEVITKFQKQLENVKKTKLLAAQNKAEEARLKAFKAEEFKSSKKQAIQKVKESFAAALDNFENSFDDDDIDYVKTFIVNADPSHIDEFVDTCNEFNVPFLYRAAGSRTVKGMIKGLKSVFFSSGITNVYKLEDANVFVKFVESLPKRFNKLLKQRELVDKKAEAPPGAPLGQIAFSPYRLEKGVPFEPNTAIEEKLYDMLSAHFDGSSKKSQLSRQGVELLRKILAKGMYAKVIHEPKQKTMFRGMNVPKSWLLKALKISDPKLLKDHGSMVKSFTFTPKLNASSWSTSVRTAEGFSLNDDKYAVVLYADRGDNHNKFIAGPGGLYKIDGPNEFSDEKECIGLGPIKVNRITWSLQDY